MRSSAFGWTGATVSASAEVVCSGFSKRRAFRERVDVRRNIPSEPMVPRSTRRVRIIHDQREALGSGRLASPVQRWRPVLSVTSKSARYVGSVGEALHRNLKWHVASTRGRYARPLPGGSGPGATSMACGVHISKAITAVKAVGGQMECVFWRRQCR